MDVLTFEAAYLDLAAFGTRQAPRELARNQEPNLGFEKGWLALEGRPHCQGQPSQLRSRLRLSVRSALRLTQTEVGPPASMCVLASGWAAFGWTRPGRVNERMKVQNHSNTVGGGTRFDRWSQSGTRRESGLLALFRNARRLQVLEKVGVDLQDDQRLAVYDLLVGL